MNALLCPHCRQPLAAVEKQFHCPSGHHFDVARGGYVNLANDVIKTGDTQLMLESRKAVFASGVYQPMIEAITQHVWPVLSAHDQPRLVDVGAGTGDVLAALLAKTPTALGFAVDASPAAAKLAQRAHPRIQAIVTNAWQQLPLADASMTVIMSVFAPRNPPEFRRIVAPAGVVVIVSAGLNHLRELRQRYDLIAIEEHKSERIKHTFTSGFTPKETTTVSWQFACPPALAYAMIAMGPNAHHHTLVPTDVTFSGDVTGEILVHVFRPNAA